MKSSYLIANDITNKHISICELVKCISAKIIFAQKKYILNYLFELPIYLTKNRVNKNEAYLLNKRLVFGSVGLLDKKLSKWNRHIYLTNYQVNEIVEIIYYIIVLIYT